MKRRNFLATLMVAAAVATAMTMASCNDKDGDNDPGTGLDPVNTELEGDLSTSLTLDATKTYTLKGSLVVRNGGVLTSPAGTVIKSSPNATATDGFSKYILVETGGRININGTAEKPVIMTSGAASPRAGDWGGLVINGKAPLAHEEGVVATGQTEIDRDVPYGGSAANDNSGVIAHLILAYTGAKADGDTEHNGLTLNGVGSGTKIDNVFIPYGADDGIEFFGGSVSVSNIMTVNCDDDMFDFTQGWNGTLTNAYGIWLAGFASSEKDPCGVEGDGNLDGDFQAFKDQSNCTIDGLTIDLRNAYVRAADIPFTDGSSSAGLQTGIRIRRGARATITNALVRGTGNIVTLVNMTDSKGNGDPASPISVTNGLTQPASGDPNPVTAVNPASGTAVTVDPTPANTGADATKFQWAKNAGFNIF
jgi:hypothetical protein